MKVLKPFNSTLRRFREGDRVNETDDFAPHTFSGLKKQGFVGDDAPVAKGRKTLASASE